MARQYRAFVGGAKDGVPLRCLCVCVAILLGPLFQPDAYAQAENWSVTILQLTSGVYAWPVTEDLSRP